MSELTTLARPYAKAAFEVARQAGQLAEWSAMLAFAAEAVKAPQLGVLLKHPKLTNAQRADLVIDVCEGRINAAGQNFIRVLADNQRLALLPEISGLFEAMKALVEQTVDVSVATPFAMTGEQENTLAQALSRKLQRKVSVKSEVDPSLIGGVVIRTGDLVIDASVRGKLAKLAEALGS